MNNDVASLINALDSSSGTQRRHAALALGAVQDPAAAPALLSRLNTEQDSCVREDLTWAVVQHAQDSESALLAMVNSDDPNQRRTGAHVMSKVGNPAHFEHVRPLVADEVVDVAIKAYRAAANTGGAAAVEALAARLGHGDSLQRDALSDAFRRIGEGSVPALVRALADEDAQVREHAAEALGYVGGPEADAAAEALERATQDSDAEVRLTAVAALGQLAFAADEPLARIAEGDDRILAAVARRFLAERSAPVEQ